MQPSPSVYCAFCCCCVNDCAICRSILHTESETIKHQGRANAVCKNTSVSRTHHTWIVSLSHVHCSPCVCGELGTIFKRFYRFFFFASAKEKNKYFPLRLVCFFYSFALLVLSLLKLRLSETNKNTEKRRKKRRTPSTSVWHFFSVSRLLGLSILFCHSLTPASRRERICNYSMWNANKTEWNFKIEFNVWSRNDFSTAAKSCFVEPTKSERRILNNAK